MIDPDALRDVFDRAAILPPQDRAAFLARECGDNAALRKEVERLLAADARAGSVFESGSGGSHSGAEETPAARDDTAALQPGARLGPYVILGPAGRGGMGEVYRARDTRLDRTVALKVLPSELVRDAAARRRFEREARAAAALSHPHICTLLDIGRQDDTDFLVMEFVDGDTLAHRLARETLPLRESLHIGIEIAEALVAAHVAHIVHRDIKPGNVMLRPDGVVKVLDFGLAKVAPIAADGGDTTQALSTRAGLIVGTVAYMSPEQARGQDVDARTDVWSLGCVLYELAAGRPPFAGTSTTDVLAAVLQSDPVPLPVIDATIPAELQRIVSKALKKDRSERYQTAQDLLIDLRALLDVIPGKRSSASGAAIGTTAGPQRAAKDSRRWRTAAAVALGAAALVLSGAIAKWWALHSSASPSGKSDESAVPRNLTRLTFDSGAQMDPTFSPDGRFVAYASDKAGNFDIWVQPVGGGNAVQITKSAAQDTQPAWSPDGSTIAFRSERDGGGLYVVPALGGPERLIAMRGSSPSWSPDGAEVRFIASSFFQQVTATLETVSLRTGEVHRILPRFTDEGAWFWVAPHPDGRFSFLGFQKRLGFGFFTVSNDGAVTSSVFEPRLPPQLSRFTDGNWNTYGRHFRWSPDGTHLVLETVDDGGLSNVWGIDVNPGSLEWKAFQRLTTGPGADVAAAFSPDGRRLAFGSLHTSNRIWQFPLTAKGLNAAGGRPLTDDSSDVSYLSVAPGGDSVAYNLQRLGSPDPATLWLKHLDSGASEPLGTSGSSARLSPDGRRVAYSKFLAGQGYAVFVQEFGKAERQVTPWKRSWVAACDWVHDSSAVLVSAGDLELWATDGRDTKPRVALRAPQESGLYQAKFSPNGRWLAFVSAVETGRAAGVHERNQVGVTSVDGLPDREWLAVAPDHNFVDKPRWSADGRTLYFLADEAILLNLWAVRFDPSLGKLIGRPFEIARFDSPSFKIDPEISFTEMDVSRKFVFLTMRSVTGNIWMLDNVNR